MEDPPEISDPGMGARENRDATVLPLQEATTFSLQATISSLQEENEKLAIETELRERQLTEHRKLQQGWWLDEYIRVICCQHLAYGQCSSRVFEFARDPAESPARDKDVLRKKL